MRLGKLSTVLSSVLPLIVVGGFWVWSFTQTDPNLLYSWNSAWVRFQNTMWQLPRVTAVWWYVGMIFLSFATYLVFLTSKIKITPLLFLPFVFLLFSNNALSHDIYNYMFNARAVTVYSQDPHVKSALEIAPGDEWLRFMHNVHTPAPYGRTWTYMSLPPSIFGMGKFLPTFFAFKVFMFIGFVLLIWIQRQMGAKNILLFALNPLVLIETFMNGHNDVWMMAPALGSMFLLLRAKKLLSWQVLLSAFLLILSTQIKEATLLLLPLWGGLLFLRLEWIRRYWAEIAAILLFIPLLTDRSQQFHPWYLIWSLTFVPFMRIRYVQVLLITFSLTSLLRYVPFLLLGEYTDTIQFQMRLVTWSALPIATTLFIGLKKKFSK